jgi:pimeloyl-ACP methyl ester carboxylesterase
LIDAATEATAVEPGGITMRTTLLLLLLALLLAGSILPAQADETAFAGYWDGSIALPGTSLGVRVHLLRDEGGAWSGTIDIPMQGAKDLPLSGIVARGDSIVFAIAGVPGNPTFTGKLEGDRIAGPFSQSGQTFEFELTRGTEEEAKRPQDPVPPFPYASEEVTFTNGDVTLAGTLTIPDGEAPFPAVVLLTGSGPQNRDEEVFDHRPFLVIADYLSRRGIAVLRYDDRGVGGSSGSISQSTIADFAGDALAAVELLRDDERIAPDRVGLLGHSEGALTAPLAATESDHVAFLVLLAAPGVPMSDLLALQAESIARADGASEETVKEVGALNRELTSVLSGHMDPDSARARIRDVILRQNDLMPPESRPTGEVLERMIQSNIDNFSTPWFQFFIGYDPRVALRKVTVPVLVLNGTLDLQVVESQNLPAVKAALAEAGNTHVTALAMPDLNHMFQHAKTGSVSEYATIDETIAPEVLETIYGWIAERFVGGR